MLLAIVRDGQAFCARPGCGFGPLAALGPPDGPGPDASPEIVAAIGSQLGWHVNARTLRASGHAPRRGRREYHGSRPAIGRGRAGLWSPDPPELTCPRCGALQRLPPARNAATM